MEMASGSALAIKEQQLETADPIDYYSYCYCSDPNLDPDDFKSMGKYFQQVLKARLSDVAEAMALREALIKAANARSRDTCMQLLDRLYQLACGLTFKSKNPMPPETKGPTPLALARAQIDIDAHQNEKHNKGGYGDGVFNLPNDKVELLLRQIVIRVLEAYEGQNKVPPFQSTGKNEGLVCAVLITNIKLGSFAQRINGKNVDKSNAAEKSCYVIVQIDLLSDHLAVHGYPCSDEGYLKVVKAGTAKVHKEMMGVLQISVPEITEYCKS